MRDEGLTSTQVRLTSTRAGLSFTQEVLSSSQEGLTSTREGLTCTGEGLTSTRVGMTSSRERMNSTRPFRFKCLQNPVAAHRQAARWAGEGVPLIKLVDKGRRALLARYGLTPQPGTALANSDFFTTLKSLVP